MDRLQSDAMSLVGHQDDYQHEGRALIEGFSSRALPAGVAEGRQQFEARRNEIRLNRNIRASHSETLEGLLIQCESPGWRPDRP